MCHSLLGIHDIIDYVPKNLNEGASSPVNDVGHYIIIRNLLQAVFIILSEFIQQWEIQLCQVSTFLARWQSIEYLKLLQSRNFFLSTNIAVLLSPLAVAPSTLRSQQTTVCCCHHKICYIFEKLTEIIQALFFHLLLLIADALFRRVPYWETVEHTGCSFICFPTQV